MIIVQPVAPAPIQTGAVRSAVVIRHRLPRGRTGPLDALLLDGETRPALLALRELGHAGLRVGAAATTHQAAAFASRWCLAGAELPDFAAHPHGFEDGLLALLDRHPARVVIPTSARSVAQVRPQRPLLERQSALALAADDALAVALDPEQTAERAARLGIATVRRVTLHAWDEVTSAVREVGLPATVRALPSPTGAAAPRADRYDIVAQTEDEVRQAVAGLAAVGATAVIEQWLPGPRETISLLHARGRVWARFAHVTHRALPGHAGAAILRESIALPRDTARDTQRLVRALDLEGFAAADFQRDVAGQPVLIQLHPYLGDDVELAVRAGINFPRLVYAWAAGETLWSVPEYRVGLRLRWLGGDLRALRLALARPAAPDAPTPGHALATLLLGALRPAGYDSLDWRDPRPTLAAAAHLIRRALRGHATAPGADLAVAPDSAPLS
ncbi:MAG TPA: hypothetical protein VIG30_06325 [Ktedonobacterales bacterium]|jgi:hypothetical protein